METSIIVLIVLIIIAVVLGLLYGWIESRSEKQSDKIPHEVIAHNTQKQCQNEIPLTAEGVEQLLRTIGAQIDGNDKIDENTNRWFICYAGGYFEVLYQNGTPLFHLYYENFFEFDMVEEETILRVMADINSRYMVWSCYPVQASGGVSEKLGDVSLSGTMLLSNNYETMSIVLKQTLNAAFAINREFHERYKKLSESKCDYAIQNNLMDFQNKVARAIAQQDSRFQHTKEAEPIDVQEEFSIGSFYALYKPKQEIDLPTAMRIVRGSNVDIIESLPEIIHFNVKDYLLQHIAENDMERIMFAVDFPKFSFVLHLHKLESNEPNKVFYQLVMDEVGVEIIRPDAMPVFHANKMVIEVNTTGKENDPWEAKFMVADAIDKLKAGKKRELSDEQRMLIAYKDMPESTMMQYYWAQKYYNADCTYQALSYFLAIYHHMKKKSEHMSEQGLDFFYEASFYIGHIYLKMGDAERAFYYLNIARNADRTYILREFVNCLCLLKDPFSIKYLCSACKETAQKLNKQDEEDDYDDRVFQYYSFLNRRLVYMLIETEDFSYAKDILEHMISEDVEVEFAQRELAHVQLKLQQDQEKSEL